MLSVIGIDVFIPVKQLHGFRRVVSFVLRQVLVKEFYRIDLAVGDVLKDRVDIGVPLRLIGQIRPRRMKYPRRSIPAGSELDAVGS